jgi:hypothetical protein
LAKDGPPIAVRFALYRTVAANRVATVERRAAEAASEVEAVLDTFSRPAYPALIRMQPVMTMNRDNDDISGEAIRGC